MRYAWGEVPEEGGRGQSSEHWDIHGERGKQSLRTQTGQAGHPDHLHTTEKEQQATREASRKVRNLPRC